MFWSQKHEFLALPTKSDSSTHLGHCVSRVTCAGAGGGAAPDLLQVQRGVRVQGGGHDQPGRPPRLETHVQGPHHEGSRRQERKTVLEGHL